MQYLLATLTLVTFFPIAGVMVLLFIKPEQKNALRWTALVTSLVTFALSLVMLAQFKVGEPGMQLEVLAPWIQIGSKWTMQIRSEYTERARTFAPTEIERDLLKTAALIAYHQPLLQSDLFDMIGSKVYEHTQALEKLGLINRRPAGRSLALTTTRYFAEFFGLKTTDREGMRKLLAEKAGVPYAEKAKETPVEALEASERPPADSASPEPPAEPQATVQG